MRSRGAPARGLADGRREEALGKGNRKVETYPCPDLSPTTTHSLLSLTFLISQILTDSPGPSEKVATTSGFQGSKARPWTLREWAASERALPGVLPRRS